MNGLILTPEQLTEILRMFNVDMREWGKPGHRTVQDLHGALQRKEGSLKINANGIALEFQTARAFIQNEAGEVLVSGAKDLRGIDNSNLTRAGLPGGRIELGESMEDALARELLQELRLHKRDYTIGEFFPQKGSSRTLSYPNLPVERRDCIAEVTLCPNHELFAKRNFELLDESEGRILVFKWIPYAEWTRREIQMHS